MWVLQSPNETLDWHQDWSDFIGAGDGVASSVWSISPEGPTMSGEAFDNSIQTSTVFLSGLTGGVTYQLRNHITTNFGRTAVREIVVRCNNRQL